MLNYPDVHVWRLIRLLRLAVALHHRRLDHLLPELKLTVSDETLTLTLPETMAANKPSADAKPEREQGYCQNMGWELLLLTD